jgi:hypothetical protein
MSLPLLPLDAVVRVLCFAGRLDVLDLLCRELRTRALSQRLLHAQLYRKVIDDTLPDSAADMAHAFGWSGPDRRRRLLSDAAELFDLHGLAVLAHEDRSRSERKRAFAGLRLHSARRLRLHLRSPLSRYTDLPLSLVASALPAEAWEAAVRRHRQALFETADEPFRDVPPFASTRMHGRAETYRIGQMAVMRASMPQVLALAY